MERDQLPRLENLPVISDQQINILRLLGKGNSPRGVSRKFSDQNSGVDVGRELKKIYATFRVTGRTAAVVFALKNGFLKTSELVEEDFDWSLFNDLKPIKISILEELTRAKDENFTEEELSRLNITSQDPKGYIWHSITAIEDKLGFNNKTEAVVYYYAFRERQQRGENSSALEKPVLTDREIRILVMKSRGVSWTKIGKSFENSIRGDSVKNHYMPRIYSKLGVASLKEALSRAKEMGILKS